MFFAALLRLLSRLAVLSLWVIVVATAAGFAGLLWWGLDLFSHFRVQYLLAAAVLALLLWALGRRRSALMAVAVVVANLAALVPLYMPRMQTAEATAAAPQARALRVMSLNVRIRNQNVRRIFDYIRRENPDVVVLLEVGEQWSRPLERLAARYPFRWVHTGDAFSGIAVLSRFAPVESRAIDLGGVGVPSMLVTLDYGRDVAGEARPDGAGRVSILGVHLRAPFSAGSAHQRDRQLTALARVAREHPWPLAIVGDLNITPLSPLFARTVRNGRLQRCGDSGGLHPTWPVGFPLLYIQIDHCLATASVQSEDFRVGPDVGSDHYPVTVRLRPAAE